MHKVFSKIIAAVMMVSLLAVSVMPTVMAGEAWARYEQFDGGGGGTPEASPSDGSSSESVNAPVAPTDKTSILPENWGITDVLQLILNIVLYGLGAAAILGVVIAGIMYMTARDNEQQVARAKTRLFEVVIGLIAWAMLYAVLNWIIPGGVQLTPSGTPEIPHVFLQSPSQIDSSEIK